MGISHSPIGTIYSPLGPHTAHGDLARCVGTLHILIGDLAQPHGDYVQPVGTSYNPCGPYTAHGKRVWPTGTWHSPGGPCPGVPVTDLQPCSSRSTESGAVSPAPPAVPQGPSWEGNGHDMASLTRAPSVGVSAEAPWGAQPGGASGFGHSRQRWGGGHMLGAIGLFWGKILHK